MVVLATGATAGFGRSIARRFAAGRCGERPVVQSYGPLRVHRE